MQPSAAADAAPGDPQRKPQAKANNTPPKATKKSKADTFKEENITRLGNRAGRIADLQQTRKERQFRARNWGLVPSVLD